MDLLIHRQSSLRGCSCREWDRQGLDGDGLGRQLCLLVRGHEPRLVRTCLRRIPRAGEWVNQQRRVMYGTRDAPQMWRVELGRTLRELGFEAKPTACWGSSPRLEAGDAGGSCGRALAASPPRAAILLDEREPMQRLTLLSAECRGKGALSTVLPGDPRTATENQRWTATQIRLGARGGAFMPDPSEGRQRQMRNSRWLLGPTLPNTRSWTWTRETTRTLGTDVEARTVEGGRDYGPCEVRA